jgi:hypothetical protein
MGRSVARDRGIEVALGIGAGLFASLVLAIMLLGGATPSTSGELGPFAAGSPGPSSSLSAVSLPSASSAPATFGPASSDVAVGAATSGPPGATKPPPAAAGGTPRPVVTTSPSDPTPPPPAVTEPPTPVTPEPTESPASPGPKRAVRDFYAAVEAKAWDVATALWSPAMQAAYPPDVYIIERFAETTAIDITSLVTTSRGDGRAHVEVTLLEYRLLETEPRTISGAWDLVKLDGVWLLDAPYF